MGVFSTAGKNVMLDGVRAVITHVGLFDSAAPLTSVTGVTSSDTFTKTSHGLADGDIVVLSALSGGVGLVVGRVYFVVGSAANTFQLALTPGGAAVDLGSDVSSVTVTELVEIAGGSPAYARKAITWNAAANGAVDDVSVASAFDVPAGATVDYVGYWSASSAGTLYAVDDVTPELFAAQGTYTLTDNDLDLMSGP